MTAMNVQYDKLVGTIIEALEAAHASGSVAPWQKPWRETGASRPNNPFTGTAYSGINRLILSLSGRIDNRWATFKQIAAAGGSVNKGAKGVVVCFYGAANYKKDGNEDEETRQYRFLRTYYVFNLEDTSGIDLPQIEIEENTLPLIDRCENIVNGYFGKPDILHTINDRAFYRPSTDIIHLPNRGLFSSAEGYYSTLFHEMIHSTGHESRLKRLERNGVPVLWGDDVYSQEELVAELGAFFLASEAQIDLATRDNHQAYLASWLKVLRQEPKMLVTAASAAQKAADYILSGAM